ncbi:hypothetical protein, partial [Alistipes putredinis]|uniref:hypothetical protein n=1 Tax=Alistipes putredinis TaxID=28117 RepID=UPI003AB25C80
RQSKAIRTVLFCVRVRNFRRFSFWANSTTEKSHLVLNSVAFGFADYTKKRNFPPPEKSLYFKLLRLKNAFVVS